MKRRKAIQLTALASANLSVLAGSERSLPATPYVPREEWELMDDWPTLKFDYRGVEICWTGWKPTQGNPWICGQWIAYVTRGTGPYIELSLPSMKACTFFRGDTFDIGRPTKEQHTRTLWAEGRKELLEEGRDRLMQIIDKYLDHEELPARVPQALQVGQ